MNGRPLDIDIDQQIEKKFNELLDQASLLKNTKDQKLLKQLCYNGTKPESINLSLGKTLHYLTQEYLATIKNKKQREIERQVLNWHVANLEYGCGTDLDPVSLPHWDQDDEFEYGGAHCFVPTGYCECFLTNVLLILKASIINKLAEGIEVIYESEVQEIQYDQNDPNSKVTIVLKETEKNKAYDVDEELPGNIVKADAVIITFSLGVLQRK